MQAKAETMTKFYNLIHCHVSKGDRAAAKKALIECITSAAKEDIAAAIVAMHGNSSYLSEIVFYREAEVLAAIVNKGAFAGMDLNDKRHEKNGMSLINSFTHESLLVGDITSKEALEARNQIYQILLYGGIETKMQELVYNTKKKTGQVVEAITAAAEAVTGWATVASGLAYYVLRATGIAQATEYATSMGCNLAYDFLKDKINVDEMSKLTGDMQFTAGAGANLAIEMLNKAWEYAPEVISDTRIKTKASRSKILSDGRDAYNRLIVIIDSLQWCDAVSMSLSLFLLSKENQDQLKKDYGNKEFLKAIVRTAQFNQDHKAVTMLLDEIFAKTEMSAKDRAKLICNLVIGALDSNNPQLVDNLLVYYRAKNKEDYNFLQAINENADLKKAFKVYLEDKGNKENIELLIKSLDVSEQDKLQFTMRIEEYGLSRQALAYYENAQEGTLLHLFVKKASVEYVAKMVRSGVDLKVKNKKGQGHTALYYAATEVDINSSEANKKTYAEIIRTLVYGETYDLFKDFGHNMGAKTEGTMLEGFGKVFREATGASFRRVTSEQSDLSQDEAAVMKMVEWLPAADLNFVMFYLVKRWPDKVLEWKDKLLKAVDGRKEEKADGTLDAVWEMAGYAKADGADNSIFGLMKLHIAQARTNLEPYMQEIRKDAEFLRKRLGCEVPQFFYKVTAELRKENGIDINTAKQRYGYYVDVYSVENENNQYFKQAVNDVLDRGFTNIKPIIAPEPKTPAQLLAYLAEKMYDSAASGRVEFIQAITKVDTSSVQVQSFGNVGLAILKGLEKVCDCEKNMVQNGHVIAFETWAEKLLKGEVVDFSKLVSMGDVPEVKKVVEIEQKPQPETVNNVPTNPVQSQDAKPIVAPQSKSAVQSLADLAEKMYNASDDRAAFIQAIKEVDTSDVKPQSFENVGQAILKGLEKVYNPRNQSIKEKLERFNTEAEKLLKGEVVDFSKLVPTDDVPGVKKMVVVEPKPQTVNHTPKNLVQQPEPDNSGDQQAGSNKNYTIKTSSDNNLTSLAKDSPNLNTAPSAQVKDPFSTSPSLDWDKVIYPVLVGIWEADEGDIKASYENKEAISKDMKQGYGSWKSTAVFIANNTRNVFFNSQGKIDKFKALVLEKLKVSENELPNINVPETYTQEVTPVVVDTTTPKTTPSRWALWDPYTRVAAGVGAVLTVGEMVKTVVLPYFAITLSPSAASASELVIMSLGGLVGASSVGLSTHKSPIAGMFFTAIPTVVSLYFGKENKALISILGIAAGVLTCIANRCKNDAEKALTKSDARSS